MHCFGLFHTAPPQLAGLTVTHPSGFKECLCPILALPVETWLGGSALTQFMGSTRGTFSLFLAFVGRENAASDRGYLSCVEVLAGRGHFVTLDCVKGP